MNWAQPEDEDFKEAKDESSKSTEDEFDVNGQAGFNSDDLIDGAQTIDKVGDVADCYHGSGKVTKEIL